MFLEVLPHLSRWKWWKSCIYSFVTSLLFMRPRVHLAFIDTFVSSALWVSVGSSFFLSLSRRIILSQAAVVSKESLLPRVKHMSSATTSDVNLTSVLRRSKSVSVSKGTNSSSFYESSLTKGLSRSRNNREWTSKDFGEIVLFSNPFFRFGFNYSRNLGNI